MTRNLKFPFIQGHRKRIPGCCKVLKINSYTYENNDCIDIL